LANIPKVTLDNKKLKGLQEVNPDAFFSDTAQVGEALLQCLIDNDPQAFMEILDSYLRVNKKRAAENADLTRSTIQLAFSKSGNPTLKTIAKIVHHEAALKNHGAKSNTTKYNR